jgi:hypothetical protein
MPKGSCPNNAKKKIIPPGDVVIQCSSQFKLISRTKNGAGITKKIIKKRTILNMVGFKKCLIFMF